MIWVAVLAGSLGCYVEKLLGYALPRSVLERESVRRVSGLLPVAMLAALVAVQTFADGQDLVIDARVAGLAAAVIALVLRAPFLVVVLVAAVDGRRASGPPGSPHDRAAQADLRVPVAQAGPRRPRRRRLPPGPPGPHHAPGPDPARDAAPRLRASSSMAGASLIMAALTTAVSAADGDRRRAGGHGDRAHPAGLGGRHLRQRRGAHRRDHLAPHHGPVGCGTGRHHRGRAGRRSWACPCACASTRSVVTTTDGATAADARLRDAHPTCGCGPRPSTWRGCGWSAGAPSERLTPTAESLRRRAGAMARRIAARARLRSRASS